jgi:hypothetical protein
MEGDFEVVYGGMMKVVGDSRDEVLEERGRKIEQRGGD